VAAIYYGAGCTLASCLNFGVHLSYQLFNLTLSYQLDQGFVPYLNREEAFVRIQNLFDRNYSQAFGFPSPPINCEAGVKLGFRP
jgi:outer membrane receptor protein involved in Fe transport